MKEYNLNNPSIIGKLNILIIYIFFTYFIKILIFFRWRITKSLQRIKLKWKCHRKIIYYRFYIKLIFYSIIWIKIRLLKYIIIYRWKLRYLFYNINNGSNKRC